MIASPATPRMSFASRVNLLLGRHQGSEGAPSCRQCVRLVAALSKLSRAISRRHRPLATSAQRPAEILRQAAACVPGSETLVGASMFQPCPAYAATPRPPYIRPETISVKNRARLLANIQNITRTNVIHHNSVVVSRLLQQRMPQAPLRHRQRSCTPTSSRTHNKSLQSQSIGR